MNLQDSSDKDNLTPPDYKQNPLLRQVGHFCVQEIVKRQHKMDFLNKNPVQNVALI